MAMGIDAGRIDAAGYAELVEDARQFLSGRSQQVQKKLGVRMSEAAAAQDYEIAPFCGTG